MIAKYGSRKRRPPCPRCEGHNQRTFSGGWANDGEIPYTYVRCEDCKYRGLQATIWLPPEAGCTSLDGHRRMRQRNAARQKNGRLPQLRKVGHRMGRRLTDDRLLISVRILPGKLEAGLAKRIERMRKKAA